MAITPIQANVENTKSHKPYREANDRIKTDNNVKPLPPKGHLVHDRVAVMPKYFVKDFVYDLKSVKDGVKGNANDHQLGRLNDVGLKLGGIGIATLLAARTSNPVARIMEYAGLGAFLAAMNIYPKVAIQAPARAMHGFDTGIEYIDDQGRKKSMYQNPNYIPFDMYRGERVSEDLDVIGDRLGIPRDIENRHDVIKEQTRKIAIQNNTLWMLTAGLATPVIAAATCYGLEKVIGPVVQYSRNASYNHRIASLLESTQNMGLDVDSLKSDKLSSQVEKILTKFKDRELPQEEIDKIITLMTENLDEKASQGVREDLQGILRASKNGFVLGEAPGEDIISTIKNNISSRNKTLMERVFVPSKEELDKLVTSEYLSEDGVKKLKSDLKALFESKIAKESDGVRDFLKAEQNRILEEVSKSIKKNPSSHITENGIKDVVNFAKIIGEFKANDRVLDKCKGFKFEYAPETVIARSYAKFEKTLFKALNISYKDLKILKEAHPDAEKLIKEKFEALARDDKKFEKAISELAKVMDEMEVALNGKGAEESFVKDLITAIENNYNNTAKRLNALGKDKFRNTIDKLVKEDVNTLSNSLKTKEDLFKLLDGLNAPVQEKGLEMVRNEAKGIGSSKNQEISRIVERYQGANNSFRRVLHTLDVFRRGVPSNEYEKAILESGREILLKADSSSHTLKFGTTNNPEYYKDLMKNIYSEDLQKSTEEALKRVEESSNNQVSSRFKEYITRFREIMGNNNIDFTKPNHILDSSELDKYSKSSRSRMSKFNLVAQSPLDMIQKAAQNRYGTQKWLRRVSIIGASVLGVTLLAQLGFGKLSNPHNLRKQVSDDTNN